MSVLDVFWIFFMLSALQPVIRQRLLDAMRMRKIAQLERDRHSRVILLVHRQETMKFLGFPVMRYIDVNDSEEVLRAIHMTDPDVPLDLVLHTPGGLVLAALQIARAVGARAVGTARTRDKLDRARPFGLDEGVLVEGDGGFADAVVRASGGRGADVVLELVGGRYLAEDLACVAVRGRILLVGLLAGAAVDLPLGLVLRKRVQITGTTLRARPVEEKLAAVQGLARHLVPLFARGALRPVVDRVLPLAEAGAAHAYVASNASFGKVVLAV